MEVDDDGVAVSIGRENAALRPRRDGGRVERLRRSRGASIARLGVLGPTRMDYSNNMAAVRAVARYLSRTLGES